MKYAHMRLLTNLKRSLKANTVVEKNTITRA